MEENQKKLMICRSCTADGWKDEQSQIWDTSSRVGNKLVFTPHKHYGLSVAVWWYIAVKLWVELFVSKGLIQAETTVSRKTSTWS